MQVNGVFLISSYLLGIKARNCGCGYQTRRRGGMNGVQPWQNNGEGNAWQAVPVEKKLRYSLGYIPRGLGLL